MKHFVIYALAAVVIFSMLGRFAAVETGSAAETRATQAMVVKAAEEDEVPEIPVGLLQVNMSSMDDMYFKNSLVEELGEGYLAFQCHDTTRDGWYFTNGKGIHVNWEKTSDYGATRYYDDYGNEIVLNTGKTMICIVEEDDNFTFR